MLGRTLTKTLLLVMLQGLPLGLLSSCDSSDEDGVLLAQNSGGDATDAVDGTSATEGTDGTTGVDGTDGTTGLDATDSTDGVDGTDGTSGKDGECGNTVCEPGEDIFSCPLDCGFEPECGDGTCDPNENGESCPEDCGPVGCLGEACGDALAACESDDGCMDVFNCLLDCETPQCAQQCSQQSPGSVPLVQTLVQCGQANGCFGGGPECGNGQCEDGETPDNCPEDCSDAPTCLEMACGDVFEECAVTQGCPSLLSCLQECESQQCQQACYQQAIPAAIAVIQQLVNCGEEAGCFDPPGPECGNNQCEQGENSNNCPNDCPPDVGGTCAGKCGQFDQNAECQCDQECVGEGDCCDDYNDFCEGGVVCGNNVCEPGENANNCPDDCDDTVTPIEECLAENCDDLFASCQANAQCQFLGDCLQDCDNNQNCQNQCFFQVGGQAQQMMTNLLNCGADAGCFGNTGPECGDGVCEDPETPNNCPEDCQVQTNSCEGNCDSPFMQNAPCQCDPECSMFGDCCPDFAEFCAEMVECGNDVCEAGESSANCPDDCESAGCLLENCDVGNCLNFEGCAAAVTCMGACESVECANECVQSAPGPAQGLLSGALECAAQAGCYEGGGPVCGDGQCEGAETQTCPEDCADLCGNGVCGAGETTESCPDDCAGALNCILNSCQVGNCFQFAACTSALECMGDCDNSECGQDCLAGSPDQVSEFLEVVLTCAVEAQCLDNMMGPVCGNDVCEPTETPDSCPSDCLAMVECGNDVCEAGESAQNCPADCGDVDPASCVFASCNAEVTSCTGDFSCTLGLQCMDDCNGDAGCSFGCAQDIPEMSSALLTSVVQCGLNEGCLQ